MKTSAIPAQITTVEDRIAGNLSLKQVLLLCVPLLLAAPIYFLLPRFSSLSLYKIVIFIIFGLVCGLLSIKLNQKIILDWLFLRLVYELRPRLYVFKKETAEYVDQTAFVGPGRRSDNGDHTYQSQKSKLNKEVLNRSPGLGGSFNSASFYINKQGNLNVFIKQV